MRKRDLELVTMIVFLIIEILNFSYSYNPEGYINLRSRFWLVHLATAFTFILFFNYILKKDMGYYDTTVIFFPCLGVFMMILTHLFKVKEGIEIYIEESFAQEQFEKKKAKEEINFHKDINLIGAYNALLVNTPDEKKKLLVEFNPPNISFKVEILQKALLDEDIDVIHYAAAELNKIDVKFQERIKRAEKTGELSKTYKAYREYSDSGLLLDSILKFYQKKTLSLLLELVKTDKAYELELLNFYKKMGIKNEYEALLLKFLNRKVTISLVEQLLGFLYSENRYREMLESYRQYKECGVRLPALFKEYEICAT